MSNQTSDNNKRIAKNTLLPYVLYDGGGCCMQAVSYREYFRIKDRHNERRTIQTIIESLYKGGFCKYFLNNTLVFLAQNISKIPLFL